jgi:cytochrome oxidase Cu insertion factor (SCO1/SenC/PrrC family)
VAAALLAASLLAGCGGGSGSASTAAGAGASSFAGAALPTAVPAPQFTLRDVRGRPVSLGEHRGGVTVVAFLDSSCTACVLIAQQVRGALDELEHPPPLLLVSVDPARDSRARVEAFLRRVSLAGRASYLVGPRAALERVWRQYRVATPGRGGDYESALTVLLIDAHGRERVEYQQEQLTPDALAHDIRALQAG